MWRLRCFCLKTKLAERGGGCTEAEGVRMAGLARRWEGERGRKKELWGDGKWHDDAECAIKYFYGLQGQGRGIVMQRNNYFTHLSVQMRIERRCTWNGRSSIMLPATFTLCWAFGIGGSGSLMTLNGRAVEIIFVWFSRKRRR